MVERIIPDHVEQFLLKHIDSIAEWEGLLLLRAHPEKQWEAGSIARKLYISEQEAAQILRQLSEKGFLSVSEENFYRYQVVMPEMEHGVTQAAEFYQRYLIPITNLIHSKAKNRIQAFADAFRIRKD